MPKPYSRSTPIEAGHKGAAQATAPETISARRLKYELAGISGVVQPLEEAGDAGGAGGAPTSFVDNGGVILSNVHVQLIFWGSAWAGTPTPSANDVTNAVANILAGPYMSALTQYRGIGRGSLRGTTIVSGSNPPASFADSDVSNLINGLIEVNVLPEPDEDTQILYCVVMPQGVGSSGGAFIGEHTYFQYTDFDFPFDIDNDRAHFAWITNDGTLDGITTIFSHELVEAVTDPEGSAILGTPGTCSQGGWCEIGDVCSTTGRVNGVQVQSYWSQRDRACIVPNGLVGGRVSGNPVLIQSRFGKKGNFEVVVPLAKGGMAHYWRNNDDPFLPWSGPTAFGGTTHVDALTMIESNFGAPGNLEVVARVGDRLNFYWRDSGPAFHWNGPFPLSADGHPITGVTGTPVLIQGRFGAKGNFELVVPLASGGLAHFWRNNDNPALPWHGPARFGSAHYTSITMIESNFGSPGNLELVASTGTSLAFFWRDSGPAFHWNGPSAIGGAGSGIPALIQSRFGQRGNFELVVARGGQGLSAFWRDNDNGAFPWHGPANFGSGHFDAVSLIESNFGSPGNLEVIARAGTKLVFFWRDSGPAFHWNGAFDVTTGV